MKIGIITQPLRYNYGGILQNYALQEVLRQMGHEVVTLNSKVKAKRTPKRVIKEFIKWVILKLRNSKGYVLGVIKFYTSDEILARNTSIFVKQFIETENIGKLINPKFDALIVGSDQVWRPEYSNLDEAFLCFANKWNVKRLAYAASFGIDSVVFSPTECEKYGTQLRRFDAVSVREKSGVHICKTIFNVDAEHVLDPTLLLTSDDYVEKLGLLNFPKSPGELFYYFLDNNIEKMAIVKKISSLLKFLSFTVNSNVEDLESPIENRIQPPVEKWLRAFYDSSLVITDSFHGCVFSIIFNKPFLLVINEKRGESRFLSLFEQLGIYNRLIEQNSPIDVSTFMEKPNVNLAELRNKSIEFLKKHLT